MIIASSENNWKTIPVQINQLDMRFGSLEALIHFSCMETRLFWTEKGGVEIPCFL